MKALGYVGCAVLVACLAPFGGFAAEGASAAGPLKVGLVWDRNTRFNGYFSFGYDF